MKAQTQEYDVQQDEDENLGNSVKVSGIKQRNLKENSEDEISACESSDVESDIDVSGKEDAVKNQEIDQENDKSGFYTYDKPKPALNVTRSDMENDQ